MGETSFSCPLLIQKLNLSKNRDVCKALSYSKKGAISTASGSTVALRRGKLLPGRKGGRTSEFHRDMVCEISFEG